VRIVPDNAKKEIKAGRLKGMTDISPMWRIKVLTEQFGPCGIGWKYKITRQWIEEGSEGIKTANVNIELYYKYDGEWSEAIPGTGGSTFVAKESKGLYTDDECYKKALTDAISVACKAIGVAADVYYDKDTTKYDTSGNGNNGNKNNSKSDSDIMTIVKRIIWELSGRSKDVNIIAKLLEEHTSFTAGNGNTVPGLKDFKDLKDKRLQTTYGRLKKEFPNVYDKVIKDLEEKKKAS
jgi:hypothetical protein